MTETAEWILRSGPTTGDGSLTLLQIGLVSIDQAAFLQGVGSNRLSHLQRSGGTIIIA
jgi:hypothetical protein